MMQAFAALPSNVTSNATLVAQTVLYHIYYGSFASSDLTEGLTIARSALNATGVVNLRERKGSSFFYGLWAHMRLNH
jgi:hypothetical protein